MDDALGLERDEDPLAFSQRRDDDAGVQFHDCEDKRRAGHDQRETKAGQPERRVLAQNRYCRLVYTRWEGKS